MDILGWLSGGPDGAPEFMHNYGTLFDRRLYPV
jgi:hypothetical protein